MKEPISESRQQCSNTAWCETCLWYNLDDPTKNLCIVEQSPAKPKIKVNVIKLLGVLMKRINFVITH